MGLCVLCDLCGSNNVFSVLILCNFVVEIEVVWWALRPLCLCGKISL